jgi:hypothetical protein
MGKERIGGTVAQNDRYREGSLPTERHTSLVKLPQVGGSP